MRYVGKYEERKLVSKVMEGADGFHLEGGSSVINEGRGEFLKNLGPSTHLSHLKWARSPKTKRTQSPAQERSPISRKTRA